MTGSFNAGFGAEAAARFLEVERRVKAKIDAGKLPGEAYGEVWFELACEDNDRRREAALQEIREKGT